MTEPFQPVFHSLFTLSGDADCFVLEEFHFTTDHNGTHRTGRTIREFNPKHTFTAANGLTAMMHTMSIIHKSRNRGRFQVIIEDDARAALAPQQLALIEKYEAEADRKMEAA